jgi:two-component sensor histidine kinase
MLEVNWIESGGPAAIAPARKGFGTLFVERATANDLSGKAEFDYKPDGLTVKINAGMG